MRQFLPLIASLRFAATIILAALVLSGLTGCESVTRYSIGSNQGVMPMADHYTVEHFR